MPAILALDEEECYLAALMDDPSGIDLAEAFWTDDTPGRAHRRYRLWDFQYALYWNEATFQADKMARSLGKTAGIIMRACAFPLSFPGQEMLITAPELNHLSPVVDKVEEKIKAIRLLREMLPNIKGGGIRHQPQFQASFVNGSRIMGRLPQRTGIGVKGQHPLVLEQEECFPAGTLVLTDRGQVPIQSVVVGDRVFTHKGNWCRVLTVFDRGVRDAVTIRGQGHPGLTCTPDHKFYALPIEGFRDGVKRWAPRYATSPAWVHAQDMLDAAWGSPVSTAGLYPPSQVAKPATGSNQAIDTMTEDFMWLLGLWLAEGSVQVANAGCPVARVSWSIHVDEVPAVLGRLRSTGLNAKAMPTIASNRCMNVVVNHTELAQWLVEHCGKGAKNKQVPPWVGSLPENLRRSVLEGAVYGDGFMDPDVRYAKGRWKVTTTSKALMVGLRLLALSLGYSVSCYWNGERKTPSFIRGRQVKSGGWYQVVGNLGGQGLERDGARWTRTREITEAEPAQMFDLEVEHDHSFLADGIMVSNSQDYPGPGWIELIETMKHGIPGAQWRAHGVSNGVRDTYHRITSGEDVDSDMPFYVHEYPAMYRPTWSDVERKQKISIYGGSRDNPDYKRNIYGEAGSVSDKVFVLARLMACVRINESSWATEYNENVYACIKIEGESLEGRPIESLINLPASHLHKAYSSYWAGMDLGFTNDPSELLIFGVIRQKRGGEEVDVLRLLARIHLMRVSAVDQEKVIAKVFEFYGLRLRALSMDKTGNGLPVWQHMDKDPTHAKIRDRIKGYGFSEKKPVEFDDRPLVGKETPEDAVIEKNIIEFATDKLREFVDAGMAELPYDKELLTEFQGQVVVYSRESNGSGGRRKRYGGGSFHTLDAAKLMVLGKELEAIELALAPKRRGPVLDAFVG